MTTPSADIYSSPAHIAFMNTSTRQRTQQACGKCRERKTKCSGEKPTCQRCTTRGLVCQYHTRESRPRSTAHSLRNSVSSIELRGESQAQAYQMHREKQREREYHQSMRHNSSNIVPYELTAPLPQGIHHLRNQPHLATSSHVPFQSYSQPSSLAGSPIYSSFSPLHSEFSPTDSDASSMVLPDHELPFIAFPQAQSQIRRTHSQSALPHCYAELQSQPFTPSGDIDQYALSLDMFDNATFPVPTEQESYYGHLTPSFYPPPMFFQELEAPLPSSRSPFSVQSETSPTASGTSDCDSVPETPPTAPVIYNPTPSLPLLFQNVSLLDRKIEQDEYGTINNARSSMDEGRSGYH